MFSSCSNVRLSSPDRNSCSSLCNPAREPFKVNLILPCSISIISIKSSLANFRISLRRLFNFAISSLFTLPVAAKFTFSFSIVCLLELSFGSSLPLSSKFSISAISFQSPDNSSSLNIVLKQSCSIGLPPKNLVIVLRDTSLNSAKSFFEAIPRLLKACSALSIPSAVAA